MPILGKEMYECKWGTHASNDGIHRNGEFTCSSCYPRLIAEMEMELSALRRIEKAAREFIRVKAETPLATGAVYQAYKAMKDAIAVLDALNPPSK